MDNKVAIETRNSKLIGLAEKMHGYQRKYEDAHDGRAVFAYIYREMTKKTAEYLAKPVSTIPDPDWVVKLAEVFAERYFDAMDAIDNWQEGKASNQEKIPKPWLDFYNATRPGKSSVLEDLVFAMQAHISYDLPYALNIIDFSEEHVEDYDAMNVALAKQIDLFERDVTRRYSRFLAFLDGFMGYYSHLLTDLGIRSSRSVAWYNACLLKNPHSQKATRDTLEHNTEDFIVNIRHPKERYLRILVEIIRWLTPVRSRRRRKWPED